MKIKDTGLLASVGGYYVVSKPWLYLLSQCWKHLELEKTSQLLKKEVMRFPLLWLPFSTATISE